MTYPSSQGPLEEICLPFRMLTSSGVETEAETCESGLKRRGLKSGIQIRLIQVAHAYCGPDLCAVVL